MRFSLSLCPHGLLVSFGCQGPFQIIKKVWIVVPFERFFCAISWKKITVQRAKLRASKFKNRSHTGLAILRDYSFSLKNQQCYRLKFTWSFPLKISIFLDSGQNFALQFPWPIGTAQRTGNCLSVSWILAINLRKNYGRNSLFTQYTTSLTCVVSWTKCPRNLASD